MQAAPGGHHQLRDLCWSVYLPACLPVPDWLESDVNSVRSFCISIAHFLTLNVPLCLFLLYLPLYMPIFSRLSLSLSLAVSRICLPHPIRSVSVMIYLPHRIRTLNSSYPPAFCHETLTCLRALFKTFLAVMSPMLLHTIINSYTL